MPLPALWTEASLLAALEAELEPVSAELGLDTLDVLVTAVTDVAAILGLFSVADATYASAADVVKVFVIGKWVAWQKASDVAITKYDVSLTGGKKFALGSVWDHIQKRLLMAEAQASVYSEAAAVIAGGGGTAVVSGISSGGPYEWSSWP